MPVDASIYGAIEQPKQRNMLADYAGVMQIQGMQQAGDMRRMQMEDATRTREQDNALAALYSGALGQDGRIDRNKLLTGAASSGLGARIPGLQKSFAEQDKAEAESQGKLLENTKRRVDLAGQAFGFVRANPTLENASSTLQFLVGNGLMKQEQAQTYLQQFQANPASIAQVAEQAFRSALDAKEQLAKIETRNLGGRTDTMQVDPVTGQTKVVNSVQNTMTPGEVAADRRARERLDFERGNAVAEAGGPNQMALTKRYGKAAPGYRWKDDGSQEAIPGGPADIKAGEAGARREATTRGGIAQADRVIAKVDEALGRVGRNSAGLGGSIMAKVPGTEATDLRADLDTIKANLGFAELQAMRDASPTGGALGAIAVQELTALQSTVASLDPGQSPEKLKTSLEQVRKHYANWKATLEGRLPQDGKPAAQPAAPTLSPEEQQELEALRARFGNKGK